jgi:hypothetical protein
VISNYSETNLIQFERWIYHKVDSVKLSVFIRISQGFFEGDMVRSDPAVMISKFMQYLKHISFADWPITNPFLLSLYF